MVLDCVLHKEVPWKGLHCYSKRVAGARAMWRGNSVALLSLIQPDKLCFLSFLYNGNPSKHRFERKRSTFVKNNVEKS